MTKRRTNKEQFSIEALETTTNQYEPTLSPQTISLENIDAQKCYHWYIALHKYLTVLEMIRYSFSICS